jgi:hypothetical protein
MNRLFNGLFVLAGALTAFALSAGPASADVAPISVPEPASMTIFGVGAAAVYVLNRFRGKK